MVTRLLFYLVLPHLAASLAAAEPVACTAERVGDVVCMAEKRCVCSFERGGDTIARATGPYWDCGPLRPRCRQPSRDEARSAPATGQGTSASPIVVIPQLFPAPREHRSPRP